MKIKFTKGELKEIDEFAQSVVDRSDHAILYLSKDGFDFRFLTHEVIGIGNFNCVKRWKYKDKIVSVAYTLDCEGKSKSHIIAVIETIVENCRDGIESIQEDIEEGVLPQLKYEWT